MDHSGIDIDSCLLSRRAEGRSLSSVRRRARVMLALLWLVLLPLFAVLPVEGDLVLLVLLIGLTTLLESAHGAQALDDMLERLRPMQSTSSQ
jgi:hypothetical protein